MVLASEKRLFTSEAVEKEIARVCGLLTNERLKWMFANCFSNTLDATVHYGEDESGNPDTYVYIGDIPAMWLRDSGTGPYVCGSKCGKIYAFEVDGFGNAYLMDDANVPSLLAMAYLGDVRRNDPIYENTRRFVWSQNNPYFWRGPAGEGIGGPHIGVEMIWPMSIMMRAFTASDDAEIRDCIVSLMTTDAGTGFMHESFSRYDASNYTRAWFAWQNTLLGELILKLVNDGKIDLLNSIN